MEPKTPWNYDFTAQEWEACLKVLTALKEDPYAVPDLDRIKGLVSKVHKNARKERRKEAGTRNRKRIFRK